MRFGLFGGARSKGGGAAGDSLGYRTWIDYVLRAEKLGFHSVFVVEHHFTGVGQVSASLSLLSYLAAVTTRIRLGTAVVVLPWHNPALLAEQVATLDLLSGGRVDLGIGKGYRDYEFHGFAIPQDEASARFDECREFLRKAWTADGRFSHHGRFWNFNDVVIEPHPVQSPHPPLWVGAGSLDSIRRAAAGGASLLLDQIAPIDLTLQRVAIYREEQARRGIPAKPEQIAVARALQLVRTNEERRQAEQIRLQVLRNIGDLARGEGAGRYRALGQEIDVSLAREDAPLLGTPDEISERLQRLQEGGVDYVLLVDPTGSVASLEAFAADVMPRFPGPKQ
jgi:alkanesulfonate monooxygenase SsuD/methylene tetrahydromethanopterin reductase-like flavin-dependent oxidoreductase (luciferase family)